MFRKFAIVSSLLVFGFVLMSAGLFDSPAQEENTADAEWNNNTSVAEVLNAFGEPFPTNRPADMSDEMVERGRSLFTQGTYQTSNGKKARRQSRFFICTDCHNMVKEDPDLRKSDPDARLEFALQNGLSFLQGTTMYGTVNKVSWYNEDYYKKYGDLVRPANKSLEAAIQLCAEVCSQGRALDKDEMNAMLAFFWSMELKLGDLNFNEEEWAQLRAAKKKGGANPAVVKGIKSFYLSGSPATFLETPENKEEGYDIGREPDAKKGKLIYDLSCRSCHNPNGPSKYLSLNEDNLSLGLLRRHITYHGHLGLYEIVRHGTYADAGHRAYMPHFTAERMSNAQVEDLRAYIESGAN